MVLWIYELFYGLLWQLLGLSLLLFLSISIFLPIGEVCDHEEAAAKKIGQQSDERLKWENILWRKAHRKIKINSQPFRGRRISGKHFERKFWRKNKGQEITIKIT